MLGSRRRRHDGWPPPLRLARADPNVGAGSTLPALALAGAPPYIGSYVDESALIVGVGLAAWLGRKKRAEGQRLSTGKAESHLPLAGKRRSGSASG